MDSNIAKKETINFWFPIISSTLAMILSLISIFFTVSHNSAMRELSFANSGLQKRPLLKFEKIDKFHYTLESKPIDVQKALEKLRQNQDPHFVFTIEVDPEITVTNEGSTTAKIICKVVTDKYSGIPEIRRALLEKGQWDTFAEIKVSEGFYKTMDMLPGSTYPIRLPHKLNAINFDVNEFTIHYLIVYVNDIGNVYDSYFWVRFKMKPLEMGVSKTEDDFHLQFVNLEGAIKVVDTHFQTYMYSYDESRKILDLHELYRKRFQQ